jgi:hypothetical protein
MNDDQIKFNKTLGQKQKESSFKECLRGGAEKIGCSGKIVAAHSIQRGKILSAIAEGSEGKVYHLGLMPTEDMAAMVPEFKLEGIKKFSTFSGFCGGHDKAIFQPIEDVPFAATAKQKNIYAYRAAAKELHTTIESKKFCEVQLGDELEKDSPPSHSEMILPFILDEQFGAPAYLKEAIVRDAAKQRIKTRYQQLEHSIAELTQICNALMDTIENDNTSEFEHAYYRLEGVYPVACCVSFIPYFDHNGRRIFSLRDQHRMALSHATSCREMKNVMFNIFPEAGGTHVIFTFSKGNQEFKAAIERLLKLDESSLKIGLSNILLNYAENSAYGPQYIEKNFTPKQIMEIKKLFSSTVFGAGKFLVGKINLFVEAISSIT